MLLLVYIAQSFKGILMKRFSTLKKELQELVRRFNIDHKTRLSILVEDNAKIINLNVFENQLSHHLLQNRPILVKEIDRELLLHLNSTELKKLISTLASDSARVEPIEDHEFPMHPGPGIQR